MGRQDRNLISLQVEDTKVEADVKKSEVEAAEVEAKRIKVAGS